jgi:hypothetical protein
MRLLLLVGMVGVCLLWATMVQAQLSYRVYSPQIHRAPNPTATTPPTATLLPTQPPASPTRTPTRTPTPRPSNCHPSYPTVCIPPPPPDLDCGDIPYRNFAVLPPDPHRFDGDRDGVGCET